MSKPRGQKEEESNLKERDGSDRTRPTRIGHDPETLELIADFLSESEEGLTQVDQVLANAEQTGSHQEQVNLLFRVFHSIKGTAGFLNLSDVSALAHAAEAVLRAVRDGEAALSGMVLEAVSEATDLMRNLIEDFGTAVKNGGELLRRPALAAVLVKLDHAAGDAAPSALDSEKTRPVGSSVAAEQAPSSNLPPGEAPSLGGERLADTLRVDVARIDAVVELVGALLVAESMVVHAPEVAAIQSHAVKRALHQVVKLTRELHDLSMRMRMIPVRSIFQKIARQVRTLSKTTTKLVQLEVEGEETEIDRGMVEKLHAPLVHIIRNALDHGIESAEERRTAGKAPVATLRLTAAQEGGQIVVAVSDDGSGLRREKILEKARSKGIIRADQELTDEQIHALVFTPGFSTASQVTEISGRGVGMDVVKKNLEKLRGRVQLWSVEGKGTTVRLVLPLTLAVIDGTFVTCGEECYVIPSSAILESLVPSKETVSTLGGQTEFLSVRGQLIPLRRLARLLNSQGCQEDATRGIALVVESGDQRNALLVDEVTTQRQVVVKPLQMPSLHTHHFSGATILANGSPGLIIDVDRLCATQAGRSFEEVDA